MSYSRFLNNDIYIYAHVQGYIECCGCWLNDKPAEELYFNPSIAIYNDDQLREHLAQHAKAGHSMPENLLQDILADPDRYGEYEAGQQ